MSRAPRPSNTVIAAGIAVAIIAVVNSLGGQLSNTYSDVSADLANAGQ